MKVLRGDYSGWRPTGKPAAMAIGVFDGIHPGHRAVLDELRNRAGSGGLEPGVLTFDPHPLAVVAPERAPRMLTDIDRRLELLEEAGMDLVAVFSFDEDSRLLSPAGFVSDVLVGGLGTRLVVVGEDFRFGKDRTGHVGLLQELGSNLGFDTVVIPLVGGDLPISSSRIRALIAAGDVSAAAKALGRRHELRAIVVEGEGRGRALGVPTANLAVASEMAVPGRGVYAVLVDAGGHVELPGVANVGVRPTFGEDREVVEVHVLDKDLDLYGTRLRVVFVDRLRDERKFADTDELRAQIAADIDRSREMLLDRTP